MKIFGKYTSTISQIPLRSSLDQNVFPHTRWWDDPKCQKSPNWLMPTTPFSYWLGPEVLSCFFFHRSKSEFSANNLISSFDFAQHIYTKYNFLHLQSMLQQGCTSQKVAQYTPGQKKSLISCWHIGGDPTDPLSSESSNIFFVWIDFHFLRPFDTPQEGNTTGQKLDWLFAS